MRGGLRNTWAAVLALALPAGALAHEGAFDARLSGFQEVPAISTSGRGEFRAEVVGDGQSARIEYALSYSGLDTEVTAAHIHFGQRGVNGAVSAFLCGGGKPACPADGTVTGTIVAGDVVGPEDRGIAAGEIEELVRAMRVGVTYANVHTAQYPEGEIRGQLREDVEGTGADGVGGGQRGGVQRGGP
jgi:hypothetical protein